MRNRERRGVFARLRAYRERKRSGSAGKAAETTEGKERSSEKSFKEGSRSGGSERDCGVCGYPEERKRAFAKEEGAADIGDSIPKELEKSESKAGEHGDSGERASRVECGERETEYGDMPVLLGNGARIMTRTPSDKPKTIADAGEMAELYFRRTRL